MRLIRCPRVTGAGRAGLFGHARLVVANSVFAYEAMALQLRVIWKVWDTRIQLLATRQATS